MRQEAFDFRVEKRGGKRKNAGRKRAPGTRAPVPHRARPKHVEAHPLHVTMRAGVRGLRAQAVVARVFAAVERVTKSRQLAERFRVVHYSVQHDHVHLVVEARDKKALTAGMRGLAVSIARRANDAMRRRGRFWGDRYHARALTGPRAVRNALVYVLGNHRKHRASADMIDACSSGPWFRGWRDDAATEGAFGSRAVARAYALPPPIAEPQTWLAMTGWQRGGRRGPIALDEEPLSPS